MVRADSFNGEVVRAQFTTKIKNNEPQNEVLVLENNAGEIYFFTELRGIQDKAIFHRWEYEGDVVKKQRITINKGQTRFYSKHKLLPKQTGKWTVVVTNEKGWPLKAAIFKYVKKKP
ncbi:MAG: DUF2914 domain-containing protein [Gammaproteobacteria bacterium]|nr:DUF2914 domain-containing protein [Gammaproteobacteria bacterium]MDH5651571.1 DUF2914 domain-containing protein [Gammaproteobacteria bacterium]